MQMPDDAYRLLDQKLDRSISEQAATRVEVAGLTAKVERIVDLDARLRAVEKFQWKLLGVALTVSVIVPIIVTVVVKYIMGA